MDEAGGVRWETDLGPAAWIGRRLHPFLQDTGSVVPTGFESYSRVFHPAEVHYHRLVDEVPPHQEFKRWSDVATENGRVVHREMQFDAINRGPATERWNDAGIRYEPWTGSLPMTQRSALIEILRDATRTAERCWFLIWDGFGGIEVPQRRVHHEHRSYGLYGGDISVAMASLNPPWEHSPNLWWPDDRSWIVVTEIDFSWTYVGGTAGLIDQIVGSPVLEALSVRLADKPFSDSDMINGQV